MKTMKIQPTRLDRIATIAAMIMAAIILLMPKSALAIAVGDRVQCTGSSWNIRSTAVYDATGANVIGAVSSPAQGLVLSGPTSSGGYVWWKVDWDSAGYPTGWSAQNYLQQLASSPGSFTLSNNAPYWNSTAPAVNLTWTTSSGVTSYDVYRNGSLYSSGVTQTSFLNSGNLSAGLTYSYYVIARNAAGTRQSNTISVTMPTAPASIPGSFTLSNNAPYWNSTAPAVNLTWTTSSGATSYDVYRNGSLYSSGVTQMSFLNSGNLSAGLTYSYYVIARNAVGTRQSNTISVTMPTALASTPGSFTLSNNAPYWNSTAPAVNLTWTTSSGVTSYDVYRNGSLYSSGVTQTSFLNSGNLSAGLTYSYYVIARNAAGTRQSNTISVTMPAAPASIPGSFTLSNNAPYWNSTAPAVNLTWTTSSGVTSYDIYRNGSLYSSGVTQTSFLNSGNLSAGLTYSYYVIARNAAGTRQSNTISVTMPAAPASIPGSFTLSNNAPYWNSTAPAVNLTWTASSSATSYDVYRNGSLYSSGVTQGSFLNSSNLSAGQTYSYYVIAHNSAGTCQSNTISVTMPTAPNAISSGTSVTTLSNNLSASALDGSAGSTRIYKISVPAGQAKLEIKTTGGSGDADLYVKFGAAPTTSNYGYSGTSSSNTETVTVNSPAAGDWYVMVLGYGSYSGLALVASYTAPIATVTKPEISPANMTTTGPVTVSMNCATSGATIRYTVNGSTPTSTSTIYGGPFILGNSATVKACAFKSGMTTSAVASATYTINSTSGVTALTNNVPLSGLSGSTGSKRVYKITVPAGQTSLVIKMDGGSGDADLYVKRGATPTISSYDFRSYQSGNTEAVTVNNPTAGDWYVMVRGYRSYSGLSLVTIFQSPNIFSFKLPLPGNYYWRCSTPAGGLYHDGTINEGHAGNYFYSLDFSWRTLSNTWPSTQDIPIYAMHSGKVIPLAFSDQDQLFEENGYSVRIDMDQDGNTSTGFLSTYIHLKYRPNVSSGSIISEGTLLGYMGTTGYSEGVHLHLGMRYNGIGSYGTGQSELEKVSIEGLKIRDFQENLVVGQQQGYYRSSR